MRSVRLLVTGIGALILSGCPGPTAPRQIGIGGGGGGANVLRFLVQPVTSHVSPAFLNNVQVAVEDSTTGVIDTTATGGVNIALSGNTTGATLSGTTTIALVAGVAAFTDLSVNITGSGYTLTASSSGFATITSSAFDIIP